MALEADASSGIDTQGGFSVYILVINDDLQSIPRKILPRR